MAKVSEHRKSYEIINNTITSLLEKGEVPWKKPWASGEPVNFITKKPYLGINPFILISSGFSCPYWVSFKQAKGKAPVFHAKKKNHRQFDDSSFKQTGVPNRIRTGVVLLCKRDVPPAPLNKKGLLQVQQALKRRTGVPNRIRTGVAGVKECPHRPIIRDFNELQHA